MLIHTLPWEKPGGQEDLPELCCLEGGVTWVKLNYSSYSHQCIQTQFLVVFASMVYWNFSAGLLDLCKGSLLIV